jgi:XapX domain-containing protein
VKIYLLSLGAGLLAGILYGVLNVRSPAPPVVALVGLLGILLGEQVPPLVRQWLAPKAQQVSWLEGQVKPHCFGELPCAGNKENKP